MGIPSGTAYVQPGNSFIVEEMMNSGAISPNSPFVSFSWDQSSKAGNCIIGGYDPNAFDPASGIFVPWAEYTKFQGVGYIWTTPMQSYAVGDKVLAQASSAAPYWFSLDSGSSQFKGDDDLMNETLALVGPSASGPPLVIKLGEPGAAAIGTLTVTPPMYNAVIQTGPGKGALISQFQPLGLPRLALVGSTLMEWCYAIFEYTVSGSPGQYILAPRGMWIFNKKTAPRSSQGARPSNGMARAGRSWKRLANRRRHGSQPSSGPAARCRRNPEWSRSGGAAAAIDSSPSRRPYASRDIPIA